MNDRELLELAAKAAGIAGFWVDAGLNVGSNAAPVIWNPLASDGDALRLSVKLRIDLDFDELNPFVEAYRKEPEGASFCADEPLTLDENAATRRAIVRAAANLGEKA